MCKQGVGMSRSTSWLFCTLAFFMILPAIGGCANRRTRALLQVPAPPSADLRSTEETTEAGSEPDAQDYIMGVEDVLDIHVWKNETLSRVVLVRPDGKISLPLIGDVLAAGLTPIQLRDAIKSRLKAYQETPEVSVILKEIGSLSVFIMGEVERPGRIPLRSHITLLQALTLAGGFTRFADTDHILLLRQQGRDEVRMQIRYQDIITGRHPEDNVQLQRNDTLVIPTE